MTFKLWTSSILTALLLCICSCRKAESTSGSAPEVKPTAPVDKTFTFQKTSLRAKNPLTVTLHITGKAPNAPFSWSVSVLDSTGTSLYEVKHDDDKSSDELYAADGFIGGGCKSYEQCKNKWYFDELPKAVANGIEMIDNSGQPVEPLYHDNLIEQASEFLKAKGLSDEKRNAVLDEMLMLLADRFDSLSFIESPVSQDRSFMYVPSLGYFVPYWQS